MDATLTIEETRGQRAYRRKRERAAQAAELRTASWHEAERIEAYLPTLYRQREEAAQRLAELDQLIADEQQAIEAIREIVD